MGRGHNGYFHSLKNKQTFYFRSLLELNYLLLLEQDDTVKTYTVEPFQIILPNNHHYTPDLLINGNQLIELKPSNHLNWEDETRWLMELEGANKYCQEHNYNFQVVYDTDINFESRNFKRWLLSNQDIIDQYNIEFIKELVWS